MKIRTILLIVLLSGMFVPAKTQSQSAANPAGSAGSGKWTVVMTGTYSSQKLENLQSLSRRILLKSNWGIFQGIDFYLTGGLVNLEMKRDTVGITNYRDEKYRLAAGCGVRINVLSIKKHGFGIWGGAQFLRFKSEGSFVQPLEAFNKEYNLTYDWREFEGYAACGVKLSGITFFGGADAWALDRRDTKKQYLVSTSASTYIGEEKGEYKSGVLIGGVFGVEFGIAGNFKMSIEGHYFSNENYMILIGIGQTGVPSWNIMPDID